MNSPQLQRRKIRTWKDKNKKKAINRKNNWKKKLFLLVFVLFILGIISASLVVVWMSRDLPDPNQLINREVAQSTKIYNRTGEHVLYEIHGSEKRTLIKLDNIPDYVKNSTIAIEDKNFYRHGGVSWWAIFRTIITDVLYNRRAGGSTLTQQFIKNAILTPEKRISRKIKEIILSQKLEKKFSKSEILQMYLNEIPYGSNAYGVEAASQKYFGKSVKDISLAEAAILAALPQAPTKYSPYGPNKDLLLKRKNYVLKLMKEQKYITTDEYNKALQEKIEFKSSDTNIIAPHFVMYIKGILSKKYGEKTIEQGGLKIYTTLDLYKQKIAEEVIKEKTKNYEKNFHANNAALVSIDPKTGQILAMVGSRDYFNNDIDGQVNVALRPRQPGSSMKPIIYASLFEKGYTPNTILYDVVTNFSTNPHKKYEPHDYNGKELGPVTIRKALAGSLNIPAVKAIYLAGINNVLDLTDSLGYTTLHPRNRFGLSLVLGGGEVKLLEHTNAYSVFARDGYIGPVVGILKVVDKNGKVLQEYKEKKFKVLSKQVVRMINDILSDNDARAFAFGKNNQLFFKDRPVAAKTGTTNDYRDAWTIGYTPSLVTGVWVGNNNNDKMANGASGSTVAAPIWHEFMKRVLGNTPVEIFKKPNDYTTGKDILDDKIPLEKTKIDSSTGLLASASTPENMITEILAPSHHSILFYVNKDNPRGDRPKNPENDPQFNSWENAIRTWFNKNIKEALKLPEGYDQFHNDINKPKLIIISPKKQENISTENLTINVSADAPRGISRIEYYINNNLLGINWGEPKTFNTKINYLNNGFQKLRIKACDDINNCTEKEIIFNLTISNNTISTNQNSIKINSPKSGLILNKIDIPFNINMEISNYVRTAKIDIIIKGDSKETITRRIMPNKDNLEISINPNYVPGKYSLYAKLYDWNGDIINSNKINFIIK